MGNATVTFTVTRQVRESQIVDSLVAACEGGSNYWVDRATSLPYKPDREGLDATWLLDLPQTFWPNEPLGAPEDEAGYRLDEQAIRRGLQVMAEKYPRQFAQDFPENPDDYEGDAETGDIFLQCCLFGEAVFG